MYGKRHSIIRASTRVMATCIALCGNNIRLWLGKSLVIVCASEVVHITGRCNHHAVHRVDVSARMDRSMLTWSNLGSAVWRPSLIPCRHYLHVLVSRTHLLLSFRHAGMAMVMG